MTFGQLVADVLARLDAAGIPHMLTGSIASSWYGEPRATQDLDVVIEASPASLDRLVDGLQADGWYVDGDAACAALRDRGQFNAIRPDAFKGDFIIRRDRPFSQIEFDRRQPVEILGTPTFIPTVEDMVIAKLEWAQVSDSDRQLRDVIGMLQVAGGDIDVAYVEGWVQRLGVQPSWEHVRDEGAPPGCLPEIVPHLERMPAVVRALLDGLSDTWLDTPDTPDGWTPRDVVGHLISAELEGLPGDPSSARPVVATGAASRDGAR